MMLELWFNLLDAAQAKTFATIKNRHTEDTTLAKSLNNNFFITYLRSIRHQPTQTTST